MIKTIEQLEAQTEKFKADLKAENRRFVLHALLAAPALLGAGVALGALSRLIVFKQ